MYIKWLVFGFDIRMFFLGESAQPFRSVSAPADKCEVDVLEGGGIIVVVSRWGLEV